MTTLCGRAARAQRRQLGWRALPAAGPWGPRPRARARGAAVGAVDGPGGGGRVQQAALHGDRRARDERANKPQSFDDRHHRPPQGERQGPCDHGLGPHSSESLRRRDWLCKAGPVSVILSAKRPVLVGLTLGAALAGLALWVTV